MWHAVMKIASKRISSSLRSAKVYTVILLVRPLFRHLLKSVENNLEGSGISVPMRGMMELLLDTGPQTVPQLARALLIPRQFALQIANDLRDAGLVEQVVNLAHKRSWLIRLTPEGHESFKRIRTQELATIERASVGLSLNDIEACRRVLVHLSEAFESLARQGQSDGKRSKKS